MSHDVLLLYHAIDLDTGVGTHQSAALTSNTLVGICHVGKMVSAIVHFFLHQREHVARARHNAKVATLAMLGVDCYSTSNFCHYFKV